MKHFLLTIMLLISSTMAVASVGAKPDAYAAQIMNARFDGMKKDLYDASRIAGISMDDLVAIGSIESGLVAHAKNRGSSAKGVLQYTNGTWIADRKKYHKELGLPANVSVTNQRANLLIGAKALNQAKQTLADRTHLTVDTVRVGDLYMLHFLGEGGAVKVINSNSNTPMNRLVSISKANRSLFVKPNGQVRTAREFRLHMNQLVMNEKSFYKEKVNEHRLAMKPREMIEAVRDGYDQRMAVAVMNTRAFIGFDVNS